MEIQLVYLVPMTLIFLNVHFFSLFRRQIRVFQSPWLARTSLMLPDQGCLCTHSFAQVKPVLVAPSWRGNVAFATAGPGKDQFVLVSLHRHYKGRE